MNLKYLKKEFFYIRKAFFVYQRGFEYLINRFIVAPKILHTKRVLEKEINDDNLSIHVLSGHRDVIMLVWALASFYHQAQTIGQLYIHSDGSLTATDHQQLKQFFPGAKIIEPSDFQRAQTAKMASDPTIKQMRFEHPEFFLLKKLLDPYFVSDKSWHLIIDSDLLWFASSPEIENQLTRQQDGRQSFMIEGGAGEPNYVYFKNNRKIDRTLANANSGLVLYHHYNFDLDRLKDYFEKLDLKRKENHHYIEQAGYAYCLKDLEFLPSQKYHIEKEIDEGTIVRHYTSPRRPWFFIEGIPALKKLFL